jgi:hypothetical protein
VQDELVSGNLRRRDQIKPDVVSDVLVKVIQCNATVGLTDRLEVNLDHLRMPTSNGKGGKTKGISLGLRSAIRKTIVVLNQFQDYLSEYKIIVYDGLSPERIVFTEKYLSNKKLYLLYDDDTGHYNVITNIKAAIAKRYMQSV